MLNTHLQVTFVLRFVRIDIFRENYFIIWIGTLHPYWTISHYERRQWIHNTTFIQQLSASHQGNISRGWGGGKEHRWRLSGENEDTVQDAVTAVADDAAVTAVAAVADVVRGWRCVQHHGFTNNAIGRGIEAAVGTDEQVLPASRHRPLLPPELTQQWRRVIVWRTHNKHYTHTIQSTLDPIV